MKIRDGLSASMQADFEKSLSEVPRLLESLDNPSSKGLLADIAATEALALSLLVFGSTAKAKHYLQKSNTRLAGMTPTARHPNRRRIWNHFASSEAIKYLATLPS